MIDIVIVNWNAGKLLYYCIESILKLENEPFLSKVFVIDNASSDNSIQILPASEKLVIIQNEKNEGFAKACNQGFRLCTAPYVLLLNPDAALMATTLKDAAAFISANNHIDILGCQLLDERGNITVSCGRFPTPFRFFTDALGLSVIFPRFFKPAILMRDWDHNSSQTVNQLMGAFMLIRQTVFDKIGYFDERFFVYYEELDFSKRLADIYGVSYFNASIQAIHHGMGTTESVKAFRLYLNFSSRLTYARKHFSFPGYLLVAFSVFTLEFISRFLLLLCSGKLTEIKDLLKGYRFLFLGKMRKNFRLLYKVHPSA